MATLSAATTLLGDAERAYILASCRADCRLDGRTCREIRPYVIVTQQALNGSGNNATTEASTSDPPLILSHGSARIFTAHATATDGHATHLLCSVKAELVQPALCRPHDGLVELHVDTAAAVAISRRQCDQLQAHLQHLLLSSSSLVDTRALCLSKGGHAWRLHVDVYVLSQAGCLLDAAARVVRAALQTVVLPRVEILPSLSSHESVQAEPDAAASTATVVVDGDVHHASPLVGVEDGPLICTVTILQSLNDASDGRPVTSLVLDATAAEEACATAQVHVAVVVKDDKKKNHGSTSTPVIVAVRKTGAGSLPMALWPDITKLAMQHVMASSSSAYTYKTATEPSSAWLLQGLYDWQ